MATMNAPTMDRRTSPERRLALREGRRSAMSALDYLAMALLIVGGLNWAMVGLFDVDIVATIFGHAPGVRGGRPGRAVLDLHDGKDGRRQAPLTRRYRAGPCASA